MNKISLNVFLFFLNHSPKKVAFVFLHLRDNDLAVNQSGGPSDSLLLTFAFIAI